MSGRYLGYSKEDEVKSKTYEIVQAAAALEATRSVAVQNAVIKDLRDYLSKKATE